MCFSFFIASFNGSAVWGSVQVVQHVNILQKKLCTCSKNVGLRFEFTKEEKDKQKRTMVILILSCLADPSRRTVRVECGAPFFRDQRQLADDGEFELRPMHLQGVRTTAFGVLNYGGSNDLDGSWLGAMATSHFGVHLANGAVDGNIPILLVHIMSIGSAFISEPHCIVVHFCGSFVEDFVESQNFTTTLLCLVEFLHKIPELGSRKNFVFGEYFNTVYLRCRVFQCRRGSSNNLKLVDWSLDRRGFLDHGF